MKRPGRNILLFSKDEYISQAELEREVYSLNGLLSAADTKENFCRVTELVNRNNITSSPRLITKETRHFRLRPFRFLINKN